MPAIPARSVKAAIGFVVALAVIAGVALALRHHHSHAGATPGDALDTGAAAATVRAIMRAAPVPAGGISQQTPPLSRLAQPPVSPAFHSTLVSARYWTVPARAATAYSVLTARPPAGFVVSANGHLPGSPPESFTSDAMHSLPFGVAAAHLIIVAAPLSATSAAVAEYAEATPRLTLTGAAFIPPTVRVAFISRVRIRRTRRQVLSRRQVSPGRTRALAESFDEAVPPVATMLGGEDASCPAGPFVVSTETFVTPEHTWVVTPSPCVAPTELRDGHAVTAP